MSKHIYSLLCLGDSYTIGEGVPLHESFPYQTVQLLRKAGHNFHAPEIVAKTGWTTFELAAHLIHHQLNEHYDFVTLLIGVNNQYRGLPMAAYTEEFDFLLRKALHYAKGDAGRVVVISVPDWGATPFAKNRNTAQITSQIDAFNMVNKSHAENLGCHYIDITPGSRETANTAGWLAADELHPSGLLYGEWATLLTEKISVQL